MSGQATEPQAPSGREAPGRVRAVGRLPLIIGFAAGPTLWSLHEIVSEFVVAGACASGPAGFHRFSLLGTSGWRLVLLLISALAILGTVAADLIAVRAWRQTRVGTQLTGEVGGAPGRSGWMAMAGILLSTTFLVGILFAAVPIFWLSGCS